MRAMACSCAAVSESLSCYDTGSLRRLVRPVRPSVAEGIPCETVATVPGGGTRRSVPEQEEPSTPRRLRILDPQEIEALYGRPCFTAEDRASSFALTPPEQDLLGHFRTVPSQLFFLLQLGYFKAKHRFFSFRFAEVEDDLQHLCVRYFPQAQWSALPPLNKRTVLKQHSMLLQLFGYRSCFAAEREQLATRARQGAAISSKPVYVFRDLLAYLAEQRIVAPGYTVLQDLVGTALTYEQRRLLTILRAQLGAPDSAVLDRLLEPAQGLHPITVLKREPKDFSLGEMRQEISRLDQLRPLAQLAIACCRTWRSPTKGSRITPPWRPTTRSSGSSSSTRLPPTSTSCASSPTAISACMTIC